MRIIIVAITRRGSQLSRRERTGYAYEIVGVAVRPQTAIEEEAAIGRNDVAFVETAVVHHYVRCDPLDLHGVSGFFLIRPWSWAHAANPGWKIATDTNKKIRFNLI